MGRFWRLEVQVGAVGRFPFSLAFRWVPLTGLSRGPSSGAFNPGESLSFRENPRPVGLGLPRGCRSTLIIFVKLLSPDGVTVKARSLMYTFWKPVQSVRSLRTTLIEITCQMSQHYLKTMVLNARGFLRSPCSKWGVKTQSLHTGPQGLTSHAALKE